MYRLHAYMYIYSNIYGFIQNLYKILHCLPLQGDLEINSKLLANISMQLFLLKRFKIILLF